MKNRWTHRFKQGDRWVYQPSEDARAFGTDLRKKVAACWSSPEYYFHLRPGGHVAAVRSHLPHELFYRTDIVDFFGSVRRTRVARCLRGWLGTSMALESAHESTVRRDDGARVLPYGFVQSPLLASIALAKSALGAVLDDLHMQPGITVSVYMDDIMVSSNDPEALRVSKSRIESAALPSAFALSVAKTAGPAAAIDAFNIDVAHASMSVSADRLDAFKIAYAEGNELQKQGIRAYVRSVNLDQSADHFT